jgi:hypothetical protein
VKAAQGFWNKVVVKESWSSSRAFARALCEKLKELVEHVTERTGSAAARTLNRVVARVRNAAVARSAPHFIPVGPLPRICCAPPRPHPPVPRDRPRPAERRFRGK